MVRAGDTDIDAETFDSMTAVLFEAIPDMDVSQLLKA